MWTIADVDSKKKGLTEKKKRQWVRVANSHLSRCEKNDGKDCEAMAIKAANGMVNNSESYALYTTKQEDGYKVSITTHQKKKHLVVPVIMMVEGVHTGSAGPLLHTMEELGKFPESWNGRPVVIYHPQEDGQYLSANSPELIDKECVGRVYNTKVDGDKLRAEVWLEEEKLTQVDEDTLEALNKGEVLEVSIGVFTEEDETSGEWNGETYEAIARNHRPDHLALLPGEVGACSVEDGCGVRINKKGGNDVIEVNEMIEKLSLSGYSINRIGDYAKQGYQALMSMVYDKLRSLDTDKTYHYLEEMYDGFLIYSKSGDNSRKMYKQKYEIVDNKVEFDDSPTEVVKEVKFVEVKGVVTGFVRTKFNTNNKKEVNTMADEKCTECVKKKVDALIANSQGKYTEADRPELETYSEAMLDKIAQPVVKEVVKEIEKKVEVNALTSEQQADLAWAQKMRKDKKDGLIKSIQDNTKDTWSVEELNVMSDSVLEKLEKSVKTNAKEAEEVIDYSAMGGGFSVNRGFADSEEPLYPTGIEIESKK